MSAQRDVKLKITNRSRKLLIQNEIYLLLKNFVLTRNSAETIISDFLVVTSKRRASPFSSV
jgi:hypothetical protein